MPPSAGVRPLPSPRAAPRRGRRWPSRSTGAAFGRAVELSPTDARAEGGRGMVYHAREEYEHAAERFQHAIELDPTYATAYAQLAWIHYGRREYDRAEPLFIRAIELDRDSGR